MASRLARAPRDDHDNENADNDNADKDNNNDNAMTMLTRTMTMLTMTMTMLSGTWILSTACCWRSMFNHTWGEGDQGWTEKIFFSRGGAGKGKAKIL